MNLDTAGATSYSPFGVMFASTGSILDAQRLHGSQFLNQNAWAYDYAFRQYLPNPMRWNRQDLDGELRNNEYGFVRNAPAAFYDILGLRPKGNRQKKKACKNHVREILEKVVEPALRSFDPCWEDFTSDFDKIRVSDPPPESTWGASADKRGEKTILSVRLSLCFEGNYYCCIAHEVFHMNVYDTIDWDRYRDGKNNPESPNYEYWKSCEDIADSFMVKLFPECEGTKYCGLGRR